MQRFGMLTRVIGVALGVVIAIAAVASASAQQEPPHRFYGTGATAGDTIGVVDSMGEELGSTTVAEDGTWYIDVDRDSVDGVSFTLNGKSADAEVTPAGSGQSAVSVTAMAMEEPAMEEGEEGEEGELAGDGDDADLSGGDDDLPAMAGDENKMSDTEFPDTGSGGFADGSGVSAGLIGLLIALSVAAVAGLGLRRVRNRA